MQKTMMKSEESARDSIRPRIHIKKSLHKTQTHTQLCRVNLEISKKIKKSRKKN